VPVQGREDVLWAGMQSWQSFRTAREQSSLTLRQFPGEEFEIEFEEGRGRLFRHCEILFPQNLVNDPGVGLARALHTSEVVDHAELLLEHMLEGLDSGAPGIDQRA